MVVLGAVALSIGLSASAQETSPNTEWISLFNGENLEGWSVKIKGYDLHDNFAETFRVEGGLLRVLYDGYDTFGKRFGHIFYKHPYSHYRLRLEYRFVGEQAPDGPGWALRNSGIMVHCQPPDTMTKDQDFPVSIEVQLLGGDGTHERATGNLCTPGTHVVMDRELIRRHCTNSRSDTYHGEQWVTAEVVVRGNESVEHIINGQTVLTYEKPQLDERDDEARPLIVDGNTMLQDGYIALQSESHPIDFRKIEILPLDE
jgi:3-keto-disaccharide hydrolase